MLYITRKKRVLALVLAFSMMLAVATPASMSAFALEPEQAEDVTTTEPAQTGAEQVELQALSAVVSFEGEGVSYGAAQEYSMVYGDETVVPTYSLSEEVSLLDQGVVASYCFIAQTSGEVYAVEPNVLDIGVYTVQLSFSGAEASGYQIETQTATLTILQAELEMQVTSPAAQAEEDVATPEETLSAPVADQAQTEDVLDGAVLTPDALADDADTLDAQPVQVQEDDVAVADETERAADVADVQEDTTPEATLVASDDALSSQAVETEDAISFSAQQDAENYATVTDQEGNVSEGEYHGIYDALAHSAVYGVSISSNGRMVSANILSRYSLDEGETWSEWVDGLPMITEVGEYQIQMQANAGDNYSVAFVQTAASIAENLLLQEEVMALSFDQSATTTEEIDLAQKTSSEEVETELVALEALRETETDAQEENTQPAQAATPTKESAAAMATATPVATASAVPTATPTADAQTAVVATTAIPEATATPVAIPAVTITLPEAEGSTTATQEADVAQDAQLAEPRTDETLATEPVVEEPAAQEESTAPSAADTLQLQVLSASEIIQVQTALVTIQAAEIPLSATAAIPTQTWALCTLLLAFVSAAISVMLLLNHWLGRDPDDEEDPAEGGLVQHVGFARVGSILLGFVALATCLLVESFAASMVLVDHWSVMMAVLLIAQLVFAVKADRKEQALEARDE